MSRSLNWCRWQAAALSLALSLALGHGALAATALGEWLVAKGTGRVKMIDCAGALWGIVSWESDPGVDSFNPDPAKRNQPITGTAILRGLKPSGANRWDGTIYNPANGRTYSGGITLNDANALRVRGCILLVLCGGENWKRVEERVSASADLACEHVVPAQPSR